MEDFKYYLEICRAEKKDDGLYIEGIASNTNLDKYETAFTVDCQEGFVQDIKDAVDSGKPLQIEIEHEGHIAPFLNIGTIVDGELSEEQTRIVARLDLDNPLSEYYYKILSSTPEVNRAAGRPEKLFFSVRGAPKKSHMAYHNQAKKFITYFDRVILRKVGLTEKPVNETCYADAILRSLGYQDGEEVLMSDETKVENEVVSEVVEEKVDGEKEAETATATDEQAEIGSDQVTEEKEKEVADEDPKENADEVTDGETVAETVVESENVERAETTTDADEVQRGALKEMMHAKEMSEHMRELNWAFTDVMYSIMYSDMENKVEQMRACVNDYEVMMGEIMTMRSLNTSDVALQKEDLDEKVELTYSLKDRFMSRPGGQEVVRALIEKGNTVEKEKLEEITRALGEVKTQLDEVNGKLDKVNQEKEELRAEVEKLEGEKQELENKVEELKQEPEAKPAVAVEAKEVKNDYLDNLKKSGDKQAIGRAIASFLINGK